MGRGPLTGNSSYIQKKKMKTLGRIIMVFFSAAIFLYAMGYLNFQVQNLLREKGDLVNSKLYLTFFYLHTTGGGLALLLGSVQFFPRLRNRYLTLHRNLGKAYVLACLIGGTSGLVIALFANGGWIAKMGFTILAVIWLYSTYRAYSAILRKAIETHEIWMIRSFALTFAAVSLRLEIPLYLMLGMEFLDAYRLVSWSCWVFNLLVAEWLIRRMTTRTIATVA